MAFLAVFAVVCLFSLFAPYSPEPRFGVGVSQPVSHAEIYRNWAIPNFQVMVFNILIKTGYSNINDSKCIISTSIYPTK